MHVLRGCAIFSKRMCRVHNVKRFLHACISVPVACPPSQCNSLRCEPTRSFMQWTTFGGSPLISNLHFTSQWRWMQILRPSTRRGCATPASVACYHGELCNDGLANVAALFQQLGPQPCLVCSVVEHFAYNSAVIFSAENCMIPYTQ
jgi:hypothetical protein